MVEGKKVLIAAAGAFPNPQVEALEQAGQTVVAVMQDGVPMGMLALRDTLRDDAKDAVDALHRLGVQGVILTGDNPRAAAAIAGELGLEFKAGLLPADKVSTLLGMTGLWLAVLADTGATVLVTANALRLLRRR